jgi:glucokinase
MDLIADIGATTTRCGLLDDRGRLTAPEEFRNVDFTGVPGIFKVYLDHRRASDQPRRAALAVAAPVTGDRVEMLNIAWSFSQRELKEALNLSRLVVVNDFAALAWALPEFTASDLAQIGDRGSPVPQLPMAALGPGSGLGVATFIPSPEGGVVAAGEGGHVTMPAVSDAEAEVIALLRNRLGHCSAERVLSGPGLVNLYWAITELAQQERSASTPAEITTAAQQGDLMARKTVAMFCSMLGTVAGNLALTVGARGGVFVGGGIAPRLLSTLVRSEFRARFEAKGRYETYLSAIPTYVITAPLPAFRGLRRLLGYR